MRIANSAGGIGLINHPTKSRAVLDGFARAKRGSGRVSLAIPHISSYNCYKASRGCGLDAHYHILSRVTPVEMEPVQGDSEAARPRAGLLNDLPAQSADAGSGHRSGRAGRRWYPAPFQGLEVHSSPKETRK